MFFFRYSILVVILLAFASGTFSEPCQAQIAQVTERHRLINKSCDQTDDAGAPYRGFKKIIILFRTLPGIPSEDEAGFIDEFRTHNFERRVERIVKENFELCLKESWLSSKPVILMEGWRLTEEKRSELLNPDHLVYIVELVYPNPHPNVTPPSSSINYALLNVGIFRAGLSWEAAFRKASISKSTAIFPNMADKVSLSEQLDTFLRYAMSPAYYD